MSKCDPLVSVCVATRNQESYIRECLMSVVAQSSDVALEILVGDDCSEDGTVTAIDEIAAAFPGIVRRLRWNERLGCGSINYQKLIREARGKYIAHLDGDDYWLPGKLRKQVAFLERYPAIQAVYSNAVVVDANGKALGTFNADVPATFDLGYLLRRGNFLCHATLLYRAKHKDRFCKLASPFIDYRLHIELAQEGCLGYVDTALAGYRVAAPASVSVGSSAWVRQLYLDALAGTGRDGRWLTDLQMAYANFIAIATWDLVGSGPRVELASLINRAWREAPGRKWSLGLRGFLELVRHANNKAGNFLVAKILQRPLKVYFPR